MGRNVLGQASRLYRICRGGAMVPQALPAAAKGRIVRVHDLSHRFFALQDMLRDARRSVAPQPFCVETPRLGGALSGASGRCAGAER